MVVTAQPFIGELLHLADVVKDIEVQNLVAVAAIEPLNERVLIGFAWLDVQQGNALLFAPTLKQAGGKLWPIVGAQCLRFAVQLDQLLKDPHNTGSGHGRANLDTQGFSIALVNDIEGTERPAAIQGVVHEVGRPDAVVS